MAVWLNRKDEQIAIIDKMNTGGFILGEILNGRKFKMAATETIFI